MLRGPIFQGNLSQLQSTVKGFSEATGHAIPTNPWPVFLEFKSAKPFFTQSPDQSDFATLRWKRETFDPTVDLGALGQAATKKIVWIEHFLRAIYDPPENRFIGFVLSGEVLSTFQWLAQHGTNTGEPLEPGNSNNAYFPASYVLELESATGPDGSPRPPQIAGVSVKNPDSVLSDQWALLWATTEMMSLATHRETRQYYDGDPFPSEASRLATNLLKAVFGNLQTRHWNADVGTLVDRNHDTNDNGIPDPGEASAVEGAPHGVDAVLAHEVQLDPNSGQWTVTDRTFRTQAQMYAANEMDITGIPTFAPQMVEALELRSITPESKVELASLDEARPNHERIMRSIREPRRTQQPSPRQDQQAADGRGVQSLDGAVVRGEVATVFFSAPGENGNNEKVCYANHSTSDGSFEVGCLAVPAAGETNRLVTDTPVQQTSPDSMGPRDQNGPAVMATTVTASEFAFRPNQIEVTPGQEVTVTFKNEGQLSHNMTIPALHTGTETIEPGATAEFTFTAPSDESTYPIAFECTVPGHSEAGMVGEIVLE